jgi:CRP/FNR family transcriptional regulator, cyclic AMP receptor protein
MDVEPLTTVLGEHPFARELSFAQVESLAGCAKNVRYAADSFLVKEGTRADAMFLIRSGRVALESHAPGKGSVQIDSLVAGDLLGWSALLPPFEWHIDARAVEPTLCFVLDGNCLRGKLQADAGFGYAFTLRVLETVSRRLAHARLQQLDVYRRETG